MIRLQRRLVKPRSEAHPLSRSTPMAEVTGRAWDNVRNKWTVRVCTAAHVYVLHVQAHMHARSTREFRAHG